jgi:tetratricopeptide (TPR) repeat protein
MKKYIISVLLICFYFTATSTSPNETVRKGKAAEKTLNENAALKLYLKAIKQNPNNIEALTGAAMMYSNIGSRQSKSSSKTAYYKKAMTIAKKAFQLKPSDAHTNFTMAVVHGREVYVRALPKTKISYSAKMKKYLDRAVKLNPNHKDAWTLLGLWHYERATITAVEKRFVKLLGGLPNGTLSRATYCLNKCYQLDKYHIMNLLTMGKVFRSLGKIDQTKLYWKKGLSAKVVRLDDKIYKQEIMRRLGQL